MSRGGEVKGRGAGSRVACRAVRLQSNRLTMGAEQSHGGGTSAVCNCTTHRIVKMFCVYLLLSLLRDSADAARTSDPIVNTKSGSLRGTTFRSFMGEPFFAFKGIPYAEPPVGDLRFQPPRPHPGWPGTRNAKNHGQRCAQFDFFQPERLVGSEDCLLLNVYTPRLPGPQTSSRNYTLPLPVMVFIHGGGFVSGSGDTDLYAPDYFMDWPVVLVTINYRLGPFGFFTTGDASAPGNYGLHDQTMALEWVQANIAVFGGNHHSVTIFGESAGGASVGLHIISPKSKGLFSRAISQSGASFCSFAANGEPQGDTALQHAQRLGCRELNNSQHVVQCLRQASMKDIMRTVGDIAKEDPIKPLHILYKPRVDRDARLSFLPVDPHIALKNGLINQVPWMSGMNLDEGAFLVNRLRFNPAARSELFVESHNWTVWANSIQDIGKVTAEPAAVAKAIFTHYYTPYSCTEAYLRPLVDMLGDRTFAACILKEIELASAWTPVYKFLLDNKGDGRQDYHKLLAKVQGREKDYIDLGVAHGEDLMYLFRAMLAPPIERHSDQHTFVRFIVSLWVSFAKDGHPSTDVLALPAWPLYTTSSREHMRLNMNPTVSCDPFTRRVEFWKTLKIREDWRRPVFEEYEHDEL